MDSGGGIPAAGQRLEAVATQDGMTGSTELVFSVPGLGMSAVPCNVPFRHCEVFRSNPANHRKVASGLLRRYTRNDEDFFIIGQHKVKILYNTKIINVVICYLGDWICLTSCVKMCEDFNLY